MEILQTDIERLARQNNITIEEAREALEEYYEQQDKAMEEVYQDIIRSSH